MPPFSYGLFCRTQFSAKQSPASQRSDHAQNRTGLEHDSSVIVENRADELTEGMTDTLAACTKGANNKQKSRQSNGARAKSRAYCFKQSFMTSLLQNYASDVHETTSLIKDIKQLQNRSCDSIILDYFNPFKGKSFTEIAEQFHFTIPKKRIS